ncbi:MAG: VOC family protein [Bacillota bacterium]|nr:VOC family protein [Bacillota bacterium]
MIRLDHLVHAVRELEGAAEEAGRLGLRFVPGGRHPAYGTRNALRYGPDLAYWELLAFERWPEEPPAAGAAFVDEAWARLAGRGPGLATLALGSDDLEAEVGRLRATGLRPADPRPGERRSPQGAVLRWRTVEVTGWPPLAGPRPFLIQHRGSEAERRRLLEGLGFLAGGGGEGPALVELRWPVPHLQVAEEAYTLLLGREAREEGGGSGRPAFRLGGCRLLLVAEPAAAAVRLEPPVRALWQGVELTGG